MRAGRVGKYVSTIAIEGGLRRVHLGRTILAICMGDNRFSAGGPGAGLRFQHPIDDLHNSCECRWVRHDRANHRGVLLRMYVVFFRINIR